MYTGDSNAMESKTLVIAVPTGVLGVLIIMIVILTSICVIIKTKRRKLQGETYLSQSMENPTISDENNDIKDYCYVQCK